MCEKIGVSTDLVIKLNAEDVEADATLIIGKDYQTLRSYRDMH